MSRKPISLPLDVVNLDIVLDIIILIKENVALPISHIASNKNKIEEFGTFLSGYNDKINSEYVRFSENLGLFQKYQPRRVI